MRVRGSSFYSYPPSESYHLVGVEKTFTSERHGYLEMESDVLPSIGENEQDKLQIEDEESSENPCVTP